MVTITRREIVVGLVLTVVAILATLWFTSRSDQGVLYTSTSYDEASAFRETCSPDCTLSFYVADGDSTGVYQVIEGTFEEHFSKLMGSPPE